MLTLFSCPKSKSMRIIRVSDDCPLSVKRRLFDLGFTQGQIVKKLKSSLLNKVILIEIRGYLLSLRSKIADQIIVEEK